MCEVMGKAEEARGTYHAPDFRGRCVDLNGGGNHCVVREVQS